MPSPSSQPPTLEPVPPRPDKCPNLLATSEACGTSTDHEDFTSVHDGNLLGLGFQLTFFPPPYPVHIQKVCIYVTYIHACMYSIYIYASLSVSVCLSAVSPEKTCSNKLEPFVATTSEEWEVV